MMNGNEICPKDSSDLCLSVYASASFPPARYDVYETLPPDSLGESMAGQADITLIQRPGLSLSPNFYKFDSRVWEDRIGPWIMI